MYSRLPQLNSIRVFDSAARLLSFKDAALELNVTATAVSHQIRALEKTLGTLLFNRTSRALSLTPEGEQLARVANHSLQQISDVIQEISNQQSILRVSTTTAFAAQCLVPNLESFYQQHSGIEVVIKTGEELDDLLKDKRIDVAIRYGQYNKNANHSTILTTECFGMFATKKYIQDYPKIEGANLLETSWKNPDLQTTTWKKYFQDKCVNIKNLTIRPYDQECHVIQAALAGQGIALVSNLLIKTALQQGWLNKHPNGEELEGLSYYILTSTQNENSKKVKIFRDWLLNLFK